MTSVREAKWVPGMDYWDLRDQGELSRTGLSDDPALESPADQGTPEDPEDTETNENLLYELLNASRAWDNEFTGS